MKSILLVLATLKIQLCLSCSKRSDPERFNANCCETKLHGNSLYKWLTVESTSEYECKSNCVYTKVGEAGSKYCFKEGGNITSECSPAIIRWDNQMKPDHLCVSPGTKIIFEWENGCYNVNQLKNDTFDTCDVPNQECVKSPVNYFAHENETLFFASGPDSLCKEGKKVKIDVRPDCPCRSVNQAREDMQVGMKRYNAMLDDFLEFYEKLNGPPTTEEMFAFIYNDTMNEILTPDQNNLFLKSAPCSSIRKECDKCSHNIMYVSAACLSDLNSCNKSIETARSLCDLCFEKMYEKCIPMNYDKDLESQPPVENSHPCDRDCRTSMPLKCVHDFSIAWHHSDNTNRKVLAYNGQIPGPTIVVCEGDQLVVNLRNEIDSSVSKQLDLKDVTTLHFHGIREFNRPWADGVPWITQCPILVNESFTYGFRAHYFDGAPPGTFGETGTFWYHSHVGTQRTNGAYGAFIIRPNKTEAETRYDVDDSRHTIIVQEWYDSPEKNSQKLSTIIINGNGILTSGFTEYNITTPGDTYLFRLIGAISQNFPLRLSIEDHKFKIISTDSQDIEPVENLDYVWVAAGERFNLVVQTKSNDIQDQAYKIKLFGYKDPNMKKDPYCTVAWLKYPGQTVDNTYAPNCSSSDFINPIDEHRTLNPVPNVISEWKDRLQYPTWKNTSENGNIFISDLKAAEPDPTLHFFHGTIQTSLLNTQYIEIVDLTFNNILFSYQDVPLLLQDDTTLLDNHCGTFCNSTMHNELSDAEAHEFQYIKTDCVSKLPIDCKIGEQCTCPHILKHQFAPGYWAEIVLINNDLDVPAHPIHQHGGWYWVVGMGKFDHNINRTWINEQDTKCANFNETTQVRCLPRNFNLPPSKDTIQVPQGGYVILRTPLNNKGMWFIHCHINDHVNHGMAMALQVGGLKMPADFHQSQAWCTGNLKKNQVCKALPPKTKSN